MNGRKQMSPNTEHSIQLPLDSVAIQQLLPHRYPFLLIDRVLEFEPHRRVLGYKNVTGNEQFFNGHFPGHPVMPGVLVLEALAQAGGVLTRLSHSIDNHGSLADGKIYYLVKIDGAKFSRMVGPGDRLDLEVTLKRTIRNMAMFESVARVDGQQVACADILCAEVDKDRA
jgi:3-hydroxyacyl-[acyl-carrier-protein] dehydratase